MGSIIALSLVLVARAALTVPDSIRIEHQHLHHALAALAKLPGETGKAAADVATSLDPHFAKEEQFALPQLSVLGRLTRGQVSEADKREALALSERLGLELPGMLADHKAIVTALARLERAAKAANHRGAIEFVEQLRLHAQTEEEVLYPAAVLVGAYLRATGDK